MSTAIGTLMFTLSSCDGDAPPTAYKEEFAVEGFLIVGEPIRELRILRSLPVTDTFRYENSFVSDAQVTIFEGENAYELTYQNSGERKGYYIFSDTTLLVMPETDYRLEVRLANTDVMTGTTTTPKDIDWTTPPKDFLPYPPDTADFIAPDSLDIAWTSADIPEYLLSTRCLDTTNYGQYLSPPQDISNKRTDSFEEDEDDLRYTSVMRWAFLQNIRVKTIWPAFRFFGAHEITIYAPDEHYLNWFKQWGFSGSSPVYNYELSNIEGGLGVFGSMSVARKETFVVIPE
jgi:hypothetical protein